MGFLTSVGQIRTCDLETVNNDGTTREANCVSTKHTGRTVAANIALTSEQ